MVAVVATPIAVGVGTAGGAQPGVVLSQVTVTAARLGGDSAVSMSLANDSGRAISLLSVTSSVARSSMIDYDVNMCQGDHEMSILPNIFIEPGQTQRLGYKLQGAMLSGLRHALVPGSQISLTVEWSNIGHVVTRRLIATVVRAPKGIRFVMGGMGGMRM